METQFLVTRRFDKSYKKLKKKYASLPTDIAQFKKDFAAHHELSVYNEYYIKVKCSSFGGVIKTVSGLLRCSRNDAAPSLVERAGGEVSTLLRGGC